MDRTAAAPAVQVGSCPQRVHTQHEKFCMSATLPVRNPRTGAFDYEIKVTEAAEIAALTRDMRRHQQAWWQNGLDHRIGVLQAWKAQLGAVLDELSQALTTDTGRRLLAIYEATSTAQSIDQWCEQAPALSRGVSGQSKSQPHLQYRSQDVPYPVVGVISPWNFPLTLSVIDTIPALLAGCAVIVKPSEITPRFVEPLMKSIAAVPELKGVLHFVTGAGETGAALVDHADIVCFTGSVATGRKVGEQAARNFIPVFLELGGKDPLIILEGADLEDAVTAALRGSIINAGQACQSIERIYVQRPLFDDFVARLVEETRKVELNYPDIHKGAVGPLIFARQAEIIRSQLDDAVAKGAEILVGGEIEDHGGLWCQPTVLTGVDHTMAIMRDETFGPIMPVMPFDDADEAVDLANDTDFGLSASIMGPDVDSALAIGTRINAGAISISDASLTTMFRDAEKCAFKFSGMGGSRMGPTALTRFFRRKALIINTQKPLPISTFDESNVP